MTQRLCVLVLYLASSGCLASGFDCARATAAIDKTLCASPHLDRLDTRLGQTYTDARRRCPGSPLQAEQRRWLREVRDRCADESCLTGVYEARLEALARTDCSAPATTCQAAPAHLQGDWKLVSESGPFEDMSFTAGTFKSWLHQRPEVMDARWHLDACQLRIQYADGGPEGRYTLLKLDKNRLSLRDEGAVAVYQRILPRHPPRPTNGGTHHGTR